METLLQINKTLNSRKGVFISFEGGEGVGKSTQIDLLRKDLINSRFNVVSTREPGGTKEAEELRKFLVTGDENAWDPFSESLIFNAIRREHVNKIIIPAIKNGSVVLCDRFIDSTIVYQGLVGEVSEKDLLELHKKYCYNLYPDITFFLDLSPQKILNRFDTLQKRDPNRIIKINADNTKEFISNEISSYVKKLLTIND